MITLETKISIPKDILCTKVNDEMVLLNILTGKYFSLDDIGTRMWGLMAEHKQLQPVYQALLAEYEVSPQELEHDLLALTDQLIANNLIQISES